ncbi:MAG TPA: OsmC family protein, partial [Gemmatimonadales bacterium]|nr:OsmC family protein [Gemmatimonadales bacterium]
MSTVLVSLRRPGACRVRHQESGATLDTEGPTEFGGAGGAFSATDLLAAALGTCIATSIDSVAVRHGIPLEALTVRVEKELAEGPRRIRSLRVTVTVAAPVPEDLRQRLRRAAEACPVHRSLHPDLDLRLAIE